MSLAEMANLFASLHLAVTPGLVSCCRFVLLICSFHRLLILRCSLPGYKSKQSGCKHYLLFREYSCHALLGKTLFPFLNIFYIWKLSIVVLQVSTFICKYFSKPFDRFVQCADLCRIYMISFGFR